LKTHFARRAPVYLLALLPLLLAGAAPLVHAQPPGAWHTSAPADAVTIPNSGTTPTVDGNCSTVGSEYTDAVMIPFTVTVGVNHYPVQVFAKHNLGDLYFCMDNMPVPDASVRDGPNAAIYIDRTGLGGVAPNSDTFAFSVSYSGTVRAARGGSSEYNGPAPVSPSDFMAARTTTGDVGWTAEFAISHALLGGADWSTTSQTIGLVVAQQWVTHSGDDYGWPNGYFWDVPDTWGRATLSPSGGTSTVNFQWSALEVTQSIQDTSNSVPLVANKRTFVRGEVISNQTRGPVTARLRGWRSGASLGPPLLPMNPGASIVAYLTPSRGNLNDSFLWELPATWTTAGTISMTADLNPYHNPSESDYGDNSLSLGPLSFQTVRPLQIRLYDVRYTDSDRTLVTSSTFDQRMLESWLRREYPISALSSTRRSVQVMGFDNMLVTDIGHAAGWVNGLMDQQRHLFAGDDPGWLYVGQVGPAGGFMRGITPWMPAWTTAAPTGGTPFCPSGGPCFDNDGSFGDWYGAHEIGHALGRPHVGRNFANIGCGADWYFFQAEYPYDTAIIGGPSHPFNETDRFFGFDAGDASLSLPMQVVPNTWTDNMSYCSYEWISDWTYNALRTYINSAFPALSAAGPSAAAHAQPAGPAAPTITGDYLFVHAGILTTTNTATIDLISRLPEVGSVSPLAAGGYELRLFNGANTLLTTYPVSPAMGSEGGSGLILSQIVTFTAGTRRVALFSTAAGHEIASVPVSAHAPVVSNVQHTGGFILPASGPVTVSWDASDADGDALRYDLQYSYSGSAGPWRTLVTGLSAKNATVDAADLESTFHGALDGFFRVVANDGINTGSNTSEKFSVADKPPVVTISSPVDFSQYGFGQTISLVADGQDFEDGTLSGAALCWTSSLDGALGCGSEINPTFLSVGTHLVTVTATDGEGATGAATVHVVVVTDASLLTPTKPKLDVSPSAGMMVLGTAGGANPPAQALTVHDLAGTSLPFTITVDQPWVTLSALSGKAPATISVTVSLTGMLAGTSRTAHITVGAAAAAASPQVVNLTLQTEGEPPKTLFLPLAQR